MKKLTLIVAALSLSACVTPVVADLGTQPSIAVGSNIVVKGTVGLADAADAYSVVAQTLAVAVRNGAFNRQQLLIIQNLNNQANALIIGSNKALTVAQRASGLTNIVTQLRMMRK